MSKTIRLRSGNTGSGLTEYNAPRKTMVGIAKQNAIFLYGSARLPNAGAVIYWFPVYTMIITGTVGLSSVICSPTKW